MSGRARGRAKGRARGCLSEKAEVPRRPGQSLVSAPRATARALAAPTPTAPAGSRQASHCSGTKGEHTPGADVGAVTSQMAGLSMGDGAGRGMERWTGGYIQKPATRPSHIADKTGYSGQKIELKTNHSKLSMLPDFSLYQYHVSFSPEVESHRMRYDLINDHWQLLGNTRAFNGMVLFLPRKLEQKVTKVFSTLPAHGSTIEVTFTFTTEVPAGSPVRIQLCNIIFKKVLDVMGVERIGRYYYDPEGKIPFKDHQFEAWPGYVTSILQKECEVLLSANIIYKFLPLKTVLDMIRDLSKQATFRDKCTKKLLGGTVLTRYSNRTYKMDDIDWNKNPNSTFKLQDGSEISFAEYYWTRHHINVREMDQPLIVSRPKKRGQERDILLLPELCFLSGLSDEVKADFRVMRDIAAHTRSAPHARFNDLKQFVKQINDNEAASKEINGWNLQFDRDLLTVNGRVLPPEKILLGNISYESGDAEWSRQMRDKKLILPQPLRSWLLVFSQRDQLKAQDFVQMMHRVAPPMGISIERPNMSQVANDRTESYLNTLRSNVTETTQMVCCILPTNRKDRYDAVKKFCCVERPVPSQMVLGKTLDRKPMLMSVCTKIAIQLNCKMDEEAWAVQVPVTLKNMMVIGIDTYHDPGKKVPSIGAFVASLNSSMTQYYSRVTFQSNMQELQDKLGNCMKAALLRYREIHKAFPNRIFVYRDGVGDGQLDIAYKYEVQQIFQAFQSVSPDYNPRTAVIVVKKRINKRFFFERDSYINPIPGTVVDQGITRPDWFDFFLVSQSVHQGTVSPTHYNVIHDNSGLKPDQIQRLTYKLCHLYYNWPGTIPVPAPCQYAHKLAFLVGESLHKEPSDTLDEKLFFL